MSLFCIERMAFWDIVKTVYSTARLCPDHLITLFAACDGDQSPQTLLTSNNKQEESRDSMLHSSGRAGSVRVSMVVTLNMPTFVEALILKETFAEKKVFIGEQVRDVQIFVHDGE